MAIALVPDLVINSRLRTHIEEICNRSGISLIFHSVTHDCASYVELFKAHHDIVTWNCRMPHRWMTQWNKNVLFIENSLLNQRSGIFIDARGFFSDSNLRHDTSWKGDPPHPELDAFVRRSFRWPPFSGGTTAGPILCCLQNGPDSNLQLEFPAGKAASDKVEATLQLLYEHLPTNRKVVIRPHPRFLPQWHAKEAEYKARCWRPEWDLSITGSVYDILPKCSALVSVNSTVVCEALTLGIPIATLGTGVFSGSEVTLECSDDPSRISNLSSFAVTEKVCRNFISAILRRHYLPYEIKDSQCNRELSRWLKTTRGELSFTPHTRLRIYAVTTPGVEQLCNDVFEASVRNCEPALDVQIARLPLAGAGDFGSKAFKAAQRIRLQLILHWIEDNFGGVILVSDVDIMYLQPFSEHMLTTLGQNDLAFQRETHKGGANLGQMLIRCNYDTYRFFETVLEEYLTSGEWEQGIVNRLLGKTRFAHCLLDSSFANTKTGFQHNMHSFHAIQTSPRSGCSSVELKLKQFDDLRFFLATNPMTAFLRETQSR